MNVQVLLITCYPEFESCIPAYQVPCTIVYILIGISGLYVIGRWWPKTKKMKYLY